MPRTPLRSVFSTPDSKRRYVRRLFATIADKYDFITRFLSYGRDRRWKARVIELSQAAHGKTGLDLACGTGDLAAALAARGTHVVGLDITHRMLQLAARRSPSLFFVGGDMVALPFCDSAFDIVTTGYGLRNVPDINAALAEIARVLKRGGLFVSLDFNNPSNPVVRAVYLTYLTVVGSALGAALHSDPDTYRYIPESIKRYPGAPAVNAMIRGAGFTSSEYIPVFGGFMAIHKATK
jgi:demethylmenaquinone methyltransferase/2-methoxy-6-polyprenyl-1,4-benzoquinol methylase